MRRGGIWAILSLLLVCRPVAAACTPTGDLVACGEAFSTDQDTATVLSLNTTGASLLAITVSYYPGFTSDVVCNDTQSNSWAELIPRTSPDVSADAVAKVQIFYVNSASPTTGTNQSFSCMGDGTFPFITVWAFKNYLAMPFDLQNGAANGGTASTSLQPGVITPSANNAVVITALTLGMGTGVSVNGSFVADVVDYSAGVTMGGGGAYLFQSTAAATNPTWSWSTSTTSAAAAIVSFRHTTPTMAGGFLLFGLGGGVSVSGGGGGGGGGATMTDGGGIRSQFRGFGVAAVGATGGAANVCHVNTTALPGSPGSGVWASSGNARACLEGLPDGCSGVNGSQSACRRYVVFDTSGQIGPGLGNNTAIVVTGPYLSVMGATAPSTTEGVCVSSCSSAGGISFVGAKILLLTNNTYWSHLRWRTLQGTVHTEAEVGVSPVDCSGVGCSIFDCVFCVGDGSSDDNSAVHDNVYDHLSIAFAGGGTFSFYEASHGGTTRQLLTDSLIAQPVNTGDLSGGGYAGGAATDTNCTVAYVRDAWIDSWGRNPHLPMPCKGAVVNNVIHNGTDNTSMTGGAAYGQGLSFSYPFGSAAGKGEVAYTYNSYLMGPSSGSVSHFFLVSYYDYDLNTQGASVYLTGNLGPGVTGGIGNGQWSGVFAGEAWPPPGGGTFTNVATGGVGSNLRSNTEPSWYTGFGFDPITTNVATTVLSNVGARPKDRDAADLRFIADATNGTGSNTPNWATIASSLGGLPATAVRTRTVTLPGSPNSVGTCGGSRTNADCFFENDPSFGMERLEFFQGKP